LGHIDIGVASNSYGHAGAVICSTGEIGVEVGRGVVNGGCVGWTQIEVVIAVLI
jgi:hypothetical protein